MTTAVAQSHPRETSYLPILAKSCTHFTVDRARDKRSVYEMASVKDVIFAPAQLYMRFLSAVTPDRHRPIDLVMNLVSTLMGRSAIVFFNFAIHVAVVLLITTPRQIQLRADEVRTPEESITFEYDYIVVGGGTTGCLIANRLVSNSNARVLLIESGGVNNYVNLFPFINSLNVNDDHDSLFNMNWHLRTTPQSISHIYTDANKNRTAYQGGGKGIGGTNQLNWQIYSLGKSIDYDRWQDVFGAKGWDSDFVISGVKEAAYQTGYKGFKPKGNVHSLSPKTEIEQVAVTIGDADRLDKYVDAFTSNGARVAGTKVVEDHNEDPLGFSLMQFAVQDNGYAGHAGRRFIYPIRKNKRDPRNERLHILLNTDATKIDFAKEGGSLRATGVHVSSKDGGPRKFWVKKDVIVTAGFYGTPALLLKSGIGPGKEQLDLKGVGANLHDHVATVGFPIVFLHGKSYSDVSLKQLVKAFTLGTGRFRQENGVTAVGFDIVKDSEVPWNQTRPNIEYILYYASIGTDNAKRIFVDASGLHKKIFNQYYVQAYGGSRFLPKDSAFATATLLHPKSRGNVTVGKSGETLIDLQYLSDEYDSAALVLGHAKLVRILYTAFLKFGGVLPNRPLPGCEPEWNAWVGTEDPNKTVYKKYKECLDSAGASGAEDCLTNSITREEKAYLKCYVRYMTSSGFHSAGTARIGSCSANDGAVVDDRCKVCGTSNVRVSDASVIPEPLSGHNIATLYGVAQLCSQKIIEDGNTMA